MVLRIIGRSRRVAQMSRKPDSSSAPNAATPGENMLKNHGPASITGRIA